MSNPVKRTYATPRRDAKALATKTAILDAASRLFTTNGYVASTIQAIADEADVAVQTVYAAFGNKRELLRQLLESAVTGDVLADPVTTRPERRALLAEPDARRRAAIAAKMATQISQRVAPLLRVLNEAAASDPDFAATAAQISQRRREDVTRAAATLAPPGTRKAELGRIAASLYALYNPDNYLALTDDFGWTARQYEAWLAEALYRMVTRGTDDSSR